MPSLAVQSLESLLDGRKLGGTVGRVAEPSRVASTGYPDLDLELGGGWRIGAMSEVIGRRASGRTSLVLRTLAAATERGQVVALVDTLDRFDPVRAEAAGVSLTSLLWVRGAPLVAERAQPQMSEHAVKQAVRACDLILRAGGFAVVVLDLADVPPRRVQALPTITWLRLAHVNEGTDTVCMLVGDAAMGRSARGASVEIAARPVWTGASAQSRRFVGFEQTFRVRR